VVLNGTLRGQWDLFWKNMSEFNATAMGWVGYGVSVSSRDVRIHSLKALNSW